MILEKIGFFFGFIDHNLYRFVWFFLVMKISCESYMYKRGEGTNVKTCYEFNNDLTKKCVLNVK
jgi:hypothetical protein